jgi:cell division protein FtsB
MLEGIKSIFNHLINHKYKLAIVLFGVWMLFIDTNSCVRHYQISEKIQKLEESKEYYQNEIDKDREAIKDMKSDPDNMEKYARERFLMKRKNEDIFIIKEEE